MPVPPNLWLLVAALALVCLVLYLWLTITPSRDRKIRVVGVGGGGANAVDAMIRSGLRGVDYMVVNTDARALRRSAARTKLAIGKQFTNGLGTGGDAGSGEVAARDATDEIGRALTGADFVVLTAGLGGGTGSGATQVVAEIARQKGVLTMAVVTTPFGFEGARRHKVAEQAAAALAAKVDAVATIPNDRVREAMPASATMDDVFRATDDALSRTVSEILDLVTGRGRMNLDFADVRSVLMGGGAAAVGIGRAAGENRAVDATRAALSAALPAGSKARPKSVLVNVAASNKLRLAEVDAVAEAVALTAGREANLVLGMSARPRLRDEVQVTVIATSVERSPSAAARVAAPVAEAPAAESADEPTEADAPADRPWQPVWLRRAPADPRAAPFGRSRRKATTKDEPDAAAAPETDADPS